MKGNLQGNYGKLFHGPYKKEIRERWLKRLLEIQRDINKEGLEAFRDLELIRIEELRAIRRIWVNEKHEFDDSLPAIYEEVIGKPFNDPDWIHNDNFNKEEWEVLKQICHEMYPEEELVFEMMYTLIDQKNKAFGVAQRKDILDNIRNTISRTFYKDEVDATQFYSDLMSRKKEHGGKYNEKFLDYQTAESEFEDDEDLHP